jgi:hypothetical protein
LQERAWWRLNRAGSDPVHVGRSVVALLDTAVYLQDVPDGHPDIAALDAAGCFRDGAFEPNREGGDIVRDWQLADESTAGPAELLTALARAAQGLPPIQHHSGIGPAIGTRWLHAVQAPPQATPRTPAPGPMPTRTAVATVSATMAPTRPDAATAATAAPAAPAAPGRPIVAAVSVPRQAAAATAPTRIR